MLFGKPKGLPVLALRDVVVFPFETKALVVARPHQWKHQGNTRSDRCLVPLRVRSCCCCEALCLRYCCVYDTNLEWR